MRSRTWFLLAAWLLVTLVVSAGTSWWLQHHGDGHKHARTGETEDAFHQWIHQNLKITNAQSAVLEPFEQDFEIRRGNVRREIREAGRELAERVRVATQLDEGIGAALDRLGRAQAELQRLTLEHFFQMKEHLEPEQQTRLRQWTHESLIHDHER